MVSLKSMKTEAVFTKKEMNTELLIFFKIVPLAFHTFQLVFHL